MMIYTPLRRAMSELVTGSLIWLSGLAALSLQPTSGAVAQPMRESPMP
jgi:hypothetical protein